MLGTWPNFIPGYKACFCFPSLDSMHGVKIALFKPMLKLKSASESPIGLGLHLHSFGFIKSAVGLRIYISNQFPGDADAAGLGTAL